MIIVPKFKELEVEVYFIRNCFEVLYSSFWVLKSRAKRLHTCARIFCLRLMWRISIWCVTYSERCLLNTTSAQGCAIYRYQKNTAVLKVMVLYTVGLLNTAVSARLLDNLRINANLRIAKLRTGQLVAWTSRRLNDSRTGQLRLDSLQTSQIEGWTTRGLDSSRIPPPVAVVVTSSLSLHYRFSKQSQTTNACVGLFGICSPISCIQNNLPGNGYHN